MGLMVLPESFAVSTAKKATPQLVERLVGLALDGLPAIGIVAATVIELVVAAIGLLMLRRRSDATSMESAHSLAMSTGMR